METKNNILQNPIIAFLKLIRIENLLIIFITQYLIRYCVMDSLLFYVSERYYQKIYLQLSHGTFFLLSLSTVLIAAAGYIINDYFDVKTDKINHPDTVVIDRTIKRRWAMATHTVFNIVGVLLAVYVAHEAGNIRLAIIHLITAGLLWFYSTTFKKQLLVGNIVVAFLTAMVPLTVLLFDMPKVIENYSVMLPDTTLQFDSLYKYILSFSLFAFLGSLIREIIKDMEDFKGDIETGCQTAPIVWGIRTAKAIVIGVISNTVLLLFFVIYKLYSSRESLPTLYIFVGLILPFIYLIYKVYRAQTQKDFSRASVLVKVIMLIGISFSFVIYYLSNYAAS